MSCVLLLFFLTTAAIASIVGASELYVRTGSTISLTCIIHGSGSIPPRVLFWFHDSKPSKFFLTFFLVFHFFLSFLRLVALDSPRGGISLETERTATGMSSKLLLTRATVKDGGNRPTSLFVIDFCPNIELVYVSVSRQLHLRSARRSTGRRRRSRPQR